MNPEMRRTLLVDALVVAVLVALALILAPGLAIVGLLALLVLVICAISFATSMVRARRKRRRDDARRRPLASDRSAYLAPHTAAGKVDQPSVRRVPSSRRPPPRQKPLE